MKTLRMPCWIFSIFLPLAAVAQADVTAAWRIPLDWISPHHESDGSVSKLDQPSGASAFFQPGDELWDISPVLTTRAALTAPSENASADPFAPSGETEAAVKIPAPPWSGKWVVWDARSEMIIARGTRNEILAVERQLRLKERPLQTRTKLELVDHSPDSHRSISLVSRAGEEASIDVDGWKTVIETNLSPATSITDLTLTTTWPDAEEGSSWELKTAAVFLDGERTLVGRHDDCEIWATLTIESIEGTPLSKMRWIEKGDATEPWISQRQDQELLVESLDSDRSIGWFPQASRRFVTNEALKTLLASPLIDAPPELHSRVHGRFFDLRPYLAARKSPFTAPGSFAGYDPLADTIVLVSSPANIDSTKDSLEDQGGFCPPSNISIETNPAAGNWFILGRSGEKQSIILKKGEKQQRIFEVSPTIGAKNELLAVSYSLDASPAMHLESLVQLYRGKPAKIGEFKPPGHQTVPVEISAHWQEVYR